ncbi:protein serrate [Trichonephila clavata]|uniref:Delta-like protein n=1 Tax=Trichonephila clavata TaxID=2740835 RepID=A0A8X6KF27_TRICU|nr:protein serrate [Trichonephila clavata]
MERPVPRLDPKQVKLGESRILSQGAITLIPLIKYQRVPTPALHSTGSESNGEKQALLDPKTFTLLLDAIHQDQSFVPNGTHLERVIERHVFSGVQIPGMEWKIKGHRGRAARISYRYRVLCSPHYYDYTCSKFCRPRDDRFGHYKCDEQGDKVCLEGWQGPNCETAVCKLGCHPEHGFCTVPGECQCRPGWKSELCDQCMPYPGCKHGYCNGSPWQCICDINWGGILCDGDLNFCGTHEPCQNGGTCVNAAPDNYTCRCAEGFSGTNCDIVDNPCASSPCLNQGTCSEINNTFICTCLPGWTGNRCQTNINECESDPCINGGTCLDLVNGYRCLCDPGWEGNQCQFDADECSTSPCVNAKGCRNLVGDYQCTCLAGWSGKNCDQNLNDCLGQCVNGATCIDLVNDYHCACLPGFTGRECQTNINECASNPCLNGGECADLIAGYRCICPVGYKGYRCEIDDDLCHPNPCHNGASCLNRQFDYTCICPQGFQGKNCSVPKVQCQNPPCEVHTDRCATTVPNSSLGMRHISSSLCGDHGKCINDHLGGFSCICDPGYTGKYCHENINDCLSSPCKNGGTCVDGLNSFQCFCQEGWEGRLCQINKNDCDPNPCKNNGSCIDAIADYICNCKDKWKGKTCSSRHFHCDLSTCQNGGTCIDMGETFRCHCKSGWEGHTCQIAKNPSCHSNPCMNGATCVNIGTSFLCICREGYEGPLCQYDSDDCNPNPCHNNGTCIDGVNWFMCKCADGFIGPDCRININECASSPCAHGSTCVDEIGTYRCICPSYLTGQHCNISLLPADSSDYCIWKGQVLPENSIWNDGCNGCICNKGKTQCTQMWCGLRLCDLDPNSTKRLCPAGQSCGPTSTDACFTRPCRPYGKCILSDNSSEALSQELVPDEKCIPNNAVLSNNCAKITLFFDKSKMYYGILVEEICSQVRKLPLSYILLNNRSKDMIIILCDVKFNEEDSIEVTISTTGKPTIDTFHTVSNVTKKIADLISRKHHNTTILTGVMEVKVEMSMVNADYKERKNYIPLLVLLLTLLTLIVVCGGIVWYYWHRRRKRNKRENHSNSLPRTYSCKLEHLEKDEKTNNLTENNLCRYHNSLQSVTPRDQQCSFVPSGSSEMIDFDPDKADIPTKIYKTKLPEACVNSTISSEKDCEKNNTFRKLSNHTKDKATGAVI